MRSTFPKPSALNFQTSCAAAPKAPADIVAMSLTVRRLCSSASWGCWRKRSSRRARAALSLSSLSLMRISFSASLTNWRLNGIRKIAVSTRKIVFTPAIVKGSIFHEPIPSPTAASSP